MTETQGVTCSTWQDAGRLILTNWRDELRGLAAQLQSVRSRPEEDIRLRVSGGLITAESGAGAYRTTIFQLPFTDCERDPSLLAAAITKNALSRDINLEISTGEILRRQIRLPVTNRRNLRSALNYELERLSPIPPDSLYFDFQIARKEKNADVDISLRIVRKEVVDNISQLMKSARLSIVAIYFEGDDKPAEAAIFPIDRLAYIRLLWHHWSIPLLLGIATLLLAFILLASYQRGEAQWMTLNEQLSVQGRRAARITKIQNELRALTAELAFSKQQRESTLFISILTDLSRNLPQDTWLERLSKAGNEVSLRGTSMNLSGIPSSLKRMRNVSLVRWTEPNTTTHEGMAQFSLLFRLKENTR